MGYLDFLGVKLSRIVSLDDLDHFFGLLFLPSVSGSDLFVLGFGMRLGIIFTYLLFAETLRLDAGIHLSLTGRILLIDLSLIVATICLPVDIVNIFKILKLIRH